MNPYRYVQKFHNDYNVYNQPELLEYPESRLIQT